MRYAGWIAILFMLPPLSAADVHYANLPLSFEPNLGQADQRVRFLAHAPGVTVLLGDTDAVLAFGLESYSAVRMKLLGARKTPEATGSDPLPGVSNCFHGNDPAQWRTGIPTFARVRYRQVYRGIDLVYYGNRGRLEYDFVVAPGADPRRIQLAFEGVKQLSIDDNGDLTAGELRFHKPVVYQESAGRRVAVEGRYTLLSGDRVGFFIGRYNRHLPLVIDPTLIYSGFLLGSTGRGIAVDSSGNAYVTGNMNSRAFPLVGGLVPGVPGAHPLLTGNNEVFVTKVNAAGSAIVYSTVFGGDGADQGNGIAVDNDGNAYIAGNTASANFPTVATAQNSYGGSTDGFVAKLNSQGNMLLFSTYLGGSANDTATGIALDKNNGNVWVTGSTASTNFPVQFAYQAVNRGGRDAFVTRYSSIGAVQYSTYLGGGQDDLAFAIAVDTPGNAYLTGNTQSSDFPNTTPVPKPSGNPSAFVTKISADGSTLAYSGFLPGSCGTFGYGIAVDSNGAAYVVGETCAFDFPVSPGAAQTSKEGGNAAFAIKLTGLAASQIVYSTFLAGDKESRANSVAVDSQGNALITGFTTAEDFPTVQALQNPGQWTEPTLVHTVNGGSDWNNIRDGFFGSYIYGIAIDPRDSNKIVVSESGVSRSIDGGATWNHTSLFDNLNALERSPANPDVLYGASASGSIYKSTDGGVTWPRTGPTPATINVLLLHPTDTTQLAAGTNGSGVYGSPDSGVTWFMLNNGLTNLTIYDMAASDSNTIYTATGNGVYKSTDGMNSWSPLQNGLPPTAPAILLLKDPANSATLYTLVNGVIYKTTDAGASWSPRMTGITGSVQIAGIAPSNSQVLYAVTGNMVYRTNNGGATWTATIPVVIQVFGAALLVVDPHNPDSVWAGLANANDVFVTRLNATGTAFSYSTYLGGPGGDTGNGIAVDSVGDAYITGSGSNLFPTTNGAFSQDVGGAFIAKITKLTNPCVYSIRPGSSTADPTFFASGGGEGQFVVVSASGCPWQVSSPVPWMQIPEGADAGHGVGPVWFEVSPNTGSARQAFLTIGPQSILIRQAAGGCSYTLSPSGVAVPSGPAAITVSLTTGPGCDWRGMPNASWITVIPPQGFASSPVTINVAPNPYGTMRTGFVNFGGGQSVAVTQAGGSDFFTFNPNSVSVGPGVSTGSVAVTSNLPSNPWRAVSTQTWLVVASGPNFTGNATVNYSVAANPLAVPRMAQIIVGANAFTVTQAASATAGLGFYPLAPCRVADTRPNQGKTGLLGPPAIPGGHGRIIPIKDSGCGSPPFAKAYSLNVTVVPPGPLTYLSMWPAGGQVPFVSTLNSFDGRVVANAAIVPAGDNSDITVYVSDTSDVIIDINGYFAPPDQAALAFYPLTPCRVADTRPGQNTSGSLGPPALGAGETRIMWVTAGACSVPSSAQAYSLNMTVVPQGPLYYLTTWPAGLVQPFVSTLNAFEGQVVANAAIVPAGNAGAIGVFVSNPSDVIVDINGYFAPPGDPGALWFFTASPCRVADTRPNQAMPPGFGPPTMLGGTAREFALPGSVCTLPAAQAYSLNLTVVPPGPLIYLSTWPEGQPQPFVSTLNSFQGKVVANAALVPAGPGGTIWVFVSDPSDVIIDVNGYFAPVM